ncbi:MAG: hypothetical protein WCT29_01475 [Candidatus Paceibacterota bacterium]
MKAETRTCQNCKKDFVITNEDFNFYEKMQVPPPTFCPRCRFQRRMTWRNDWHVFKKTDARTGEKIFSFLPEESPIKIYDRDFWFSDGWDPMIYGREFDFSRPFFEQFKELLHEVPWPSTSMERAVHCSYCTNATNIKNCYYVRGATNTEDSAYLIWDHGSRGSLESHMTNSCELSYGNVNCITCYQTLFSVDCESSQELTFCKDCVGCNSCFGSVGLRNKSYYIFNQPYEREEYLKKIKELHLGSYKNFETIKHEAYAHWLNYPQKFIHSRQNVNVSGDYIYESKNTHDCYRVVGVEDSKWVQNVTNGPVRDCYDYSNFGNNAELIYESLIVGTGAYNVKFSTHCFPELRESSYCVFCISSAYLFGCISLRGKKYCILNKQYTKEEYEALVPKIIEHMKMTGEYGEFFPSALAPHPYEVSAAQEFFPLSKDEMEKQGFVYYGIEKPKYDITLKTGDLPDDIKDIDQEILNEVFGCEHKDSCKHECTGAFRAIKTELDFLKRMGLPFPRLCPNCRHAERLSLRNPPLLYDRTCIKCSKAIKTGYAPERPEIVYCEKCYQAEVY